MSILAPPPLKSLFNGGIVSLKMEIPRAKPEVVCISGTRARELRKALDPRVSQDALAPQVGVHRTRITQIERSATVNVTQPVAERLAAALRTTIEDLSPDPTKDYSQRALGSRLALIEDQLTEMMQRLEQITEAQKRLEDLLTQATKPAVSTSHSRPSHAVRDHQGS
jgi:DNA-binding XRE family transcriptional regulator